MKKTGQTTGDEPLPGQGIRSLHGWQRLSAARRAIAGDEEAQRRLADDPAPVLTGLGVDPGFVKAFLHQQEAMRAPVEPVRDFAGRDQDDDDDDDDGAESALRGGCGGPAPEAGPAEVVSSKAGRVSLRVL